MAITSIFDVARTLQLFFERMGRPPWSVKDIKGHWHLVDAAGKVMGINFGETSKPLPEPAVDFMESLNYRPALRRVKIEHNAADPSDLCVVSAANVSELHTAAMLTSIMNSTGTLQDSKVTEVSGELAPSILKYDRHGIIPMCISGPMDYVPNVNLKERKKYEH